uniref:Uncharacterized protein n=2 Tax=Rhodnius prolixus TaxID=13249 RepID=T1HED4_RHOPR
MASFVPVETQAIYMKNRGVQCGEMSFKKDKYINNEPLNTIQYIIMNMKSKLKDDPNLESMLDEMELVLRRLPLDRGDSRNIDNLAKDYRSSSYERYLHPKPNFSKPKMRPSYGDVLNLEATYQELEATCKKLKKERDVAIEKASQKSVELVESMRREVETKSKLNETNSKIKEMSAKLETY